MSLRSAVTSREGWKLFPMVTKQMSKLSTPISSDHGVHEVRGEAVDELFVLVDDHDLIAEVGQFFGKIGAESSHSDDEYGFHGSPL